MNDEIRKKHEEYVKDVRKENRFIPSLLSCAEVDALFRALDAERGKVEKVREWMTESGFCSAPYCKKCVIKLEQILK